MSIARLFLLPVLLLSLFAAAQDIGLPPNIPADKVAAAAKPFLGYWDGISCEDPFVGVRFLAEQTKPTDFPQFTLLAVTDGDKIDAVGEKWYSLVFTTKIDDKAGTHDFLYFSNEKTLLMLAAVNSNLVGMAVTDDRKMLVLLRPMNPAEDVSTAMREMKVLCKDVAARRKFAGIKDAPTTKK